VLAAFALALAAHAAAPTPVRLAVTDLEGLEQLQREFGAFKELLSQKSGLAVTFFPVPNRTAAVEALRAKRVDVVLTGPAEYVIFRTRTDSVPIAGFSRPSYFADLIVLAESGITRVEQLKGKKIALGAVGSTSKHLAPMQILKDHGLDPLTQVEIAHIDSYKTAWEALKRGDVQAFGTTDDKFLALRDKETELPPGAFRVLARSGDLPNDVLVARADLDRAVIERLVGALRDHSSELIAAILAGEDNQKYRGMKFLTGVADSDYDPVRAMYRTAGYAQLARFIGE
jgi:phosphonate transport system substrate-binding protein